MLFRGSVIGPTFHFSVPKLKFGMVSYGKNFFLCILFLIFFFISICQWKIPLNLSVLHRRVRAIQQMRWLARGNHGNVATPLALVTMSSRWQKLILNISCPQERVGGVKTRQYSKPYVKAKHQCKQQQWHMDNGNYWTAIHSKLT